MAKMEKLIIKKTEETPAVIFNPQRNEETIFQFRLNYMNTASAKQVARILSLLKKYSKDHKIAFQWFYEKGDLDMLKEAKRFSLILNIDFNIIEK